MPIPDDDNRAWLEQQFQRSVGRTATELRELADWMEQRAAAISQVDGKDHTAVQLVSGLLARTMNVLPNSGFTLLFAAAEQFDRAVSSGLVGGTPNEQ